MNDPKYDIVDGRLWHREGRYFIPPEEPLLLLRGKDPVAIAAMQAYIAAHSDDAHREGMKKRLEAFRAYQEKYPERTKVGCHMHKEGQ